MTKLTKWALIVPLVGSLITSVIWVETRYQQVDVAVCHLSRSALELEVATNELRLEFYNQELLGLLTSGGSDSRVRHLEASTLSIEARLRVIKTILAGKSC